MENYGQSTADTRYMGFAFHRGLAVVFDYVDSFWGSNPDYFQAKTMDAINAGHQMAEIERDPGDRPPLLRLRLGLERESYVFYTVEWHGFLIRGYGVPYEDEFGAGYLFEEPWWIECFYDYTDLLDFRD